MAAIYLGSSVGFATREQEPLLMLPLCALSSRTIYCSADRFRPVAAIASSQKQAVNLMEAVVRATFQE